MIGGGGELVAHWHNYLNFYILQSKYTNIMAIYLLEYQIHAYIQKEMYPEDSFSSPNYKCLVTSMVSMVSPHTSRSNLTNMN